MMKSNICFCLISILTLLISNQSHACGPFEYYPYGYMMYRVHEKNAEVKPDERKENCRLWQKLSSEEIPLEDIEKVVYKYTLDQMKDMMTVKDPNAFASWIRKNNDMEIYEFLKLAKICERTRGLMNDPWYYPSKNDGTFMSLIEIEEKAKEYSGSRLKDRYALQAVRAMFSAKRYKECIEYWEGIKDCLPEGLIKNMTHSYLLGAYSRTGKADYALEYFAQTGDLNSIIYCLRQMGIISDTKSELECIAQYAPDSHQIPELLQKAMEDFEPRGYEYRTYQYRRDSTSVSDYMRKSFDWFYDLSVKMSGEKSANQAVWCYTAAFLADLDAKPDKALKHIRDASACQTSEFMKESIRVMRMYLDAKTSSYDKAYEERLFKDLKWLDEKIRKNINEDIRNDQYGMYGIYMRVNIGFYYWNDMLRRILLAEVCPRMIDRGMYVRALQLANLADNTLLNYIGQMDGMPLSKYRKDVEHNQIDYCSEFFQLMFHAVPMNDLLSYTGRAMSCTTEFDTFLNSRGFIDNDYFNDLIGTRYLREMDYANAVKYLSKVPSSYQSRLNTEIYMYRDPFSIGQNTLTDYKDYKMEFAKEMLRLEKSITSDIDPSRKGFEMIRYATGLMNSFTRCWPLTDYGRFSGSWEYETVTDDFYSKAEKHYREALRIIDNDELAAIAHIQLCQWRTAVEKYPDTYASRYIQIKCDNLCDYKLEHVLSEPFQY